MRLQAGIALTILLAALAGCAGKSTNRTAPLSVAAASDLQLPFEEIGAQFEQQTGTHVSFSFASTGMLAQQIENGAPFDVFAAANASFVDQLKTQGDVLADTIAPYARGSIILASSKKAGIHVQSLANLEDPAIRYIAIANPDHAPYGLAARQALESAGVLDKVRAKLVLGESVRQTLVTVQTGNAEVGIIAKSLANFPDIEWEPIDESLHEPIMQTIAVVTQSDQLGLAREFVKLVLSEAGQEVLARFGFGPP